MKKMQIQRKFFAILLALITGIFLHSSFSAAGATQESPFDLIIKIDQLEKTLDIIDDLAIVDSSRPLTTPLRGMLYGTEWIDPDRRIVIGIEMKNSQPIGTALIPFRQANVDFQTTFQASVGPDYYILSFPPGQEVNISGELEAALNAASKARTAISISGELRVSELLKKEEGKIQEALKNLEDMPSDDSGKFAPKPQEIKCLLLNLLDTARQVELLTLGLDFNKGKITSFIEAKAGKETRLAELFTEHSKTMRLGNYRPQHQINFRSRGYDIGTAAEFINIFFGDFYNSMGIDFASLIEISKSFTGEMVGGMSINKTGAEFEMISVLKETSVENDFLETLYLPWLEKYNQSMAPIMEKQFPGQSAKLYERTDDSMVAGHKVVGLITKVPPLFLENNMYSNPDSARRMKYEMRMTIVGNLLLVAPDDKRINELIRVSKTFKENPAEGSLISFDIDIADHFNSAMKMLPGFPSCGKPLPKMGRITARFDLTDGRAVSESSIMIDDIKKIICYFKELSASAKTCSLEKETENKKTTYKENAVEIVQKTKKEPAEWGVTNRDAPEPGATKEDAAYWSNKGSLCAVYGNDKAAIQYFKKAIELEPQKSEAYYLLGVSYGEIGNFENAISSINKALELKSGEALYYYGRGRIYLLFSEKDKAMEDLKLAARLGNRDAQTYLNKYEACLQ